MAGRARPTTRKKKLDLGFGRMYPGVYPARFSRNAWDTPPALFQAGALKNAYAFPPGAGRLEQESSHGPV